VYGNLLVLLCNIFTAAAFMSNKPQPPPPATKTGSGNIIDKQFTGGAFLPNEVDPEETMAQAVKLASRIKTVKDLGWKQPPKRRGNARPRPRAWGGEKEMPVQLKPNYDESKEKCVEKWLTIEDFCTNLRTSQGPVADTVYVALAGGSKYAEREECEKIINVWYSDGKKFDETAFTKSVQSGRTKLAVGWGSFLSINTFFLSCIIFPTNPAAKALENLVSQVQGGYV